MVPELQELPEVPRLDNPRHERFANLVAKGDITDTEAYQCALQTTWEAADGNAWRLRGDEGIAARIAYLQQVLRVDARGTILTLKERREYLAKVVRTPIAEVNEQSVLCQEVNRDGETGAVTKIKMPGKLDALRLDAELAGELGSGARIRVGVQIGECLNLLADIDP